MNFRLILAAMAALCFNAWCPIAAVAAGIHGAGATFPEPVYLAWATQYEQSSGVKVTYDAVGSGAGLDRIRRREVDFGASDAPLTQQELSASGLVQFPIIVGGVVPVINITGIRPGQLKLSGALLADIYLGKIHKWNEAPIAALNPDIALPSANITVVHRSDPSGSSLLWGDYLSRSSVAWSREVGACLSPNWPTGVGGVGNEGVASYVQRTRFAIGYVEYFFSRNHHLSDVALRNESGRFVHAGRETFHAAAEAANWGSVASIRQLPTNAPGAQSWPITGASFILVARPRDDRGATLAVLRFFNWALHEGEPVVRKLDYVPLPKWVVEEIPTLWRTLLDSKGRPIWP
jgi:phosphate transport system substrate-binding protein